MWRAFGMSTARVAIVFKVPRFSQGALALRLMFSPVAYLTEDQVHGVIAEVITNLGTSRDFVRSVDRHVVVETVFMMLLAGVTCLKHEGFSRGTRVESDLLSQILPVGSDGVRDRGRGRSATARLQAPPRRDGFVGSR
jgi:hypothetical protein